VEKPYFEKALEYVNSGQYRWNAGMFIWSFVTITEGLQKHQPEMYRSLPALVQSRRPADQARQGPRQRISRAEEDLH